MDSYHVENQTPQVAMAQASGQAVDILDADDDRLSNWDEQDLMYEVQSQDQYTNMINLPDGIESIYPVDLTRPMTETLQLVYATQGGKRPREEDSRTESPPPGPLGSHRQHHCLYDSARACDCCVSSSFKSLFYLFQGPKDSFP
ncbi:uncharacterized protein N7525_005002 [Penicillium rubens]|jgi:hypothetical protein|nr:uncharacterized protein N7525_005002 [Penicillium rubens]KAJ5839814.1 hypothetical protein N7525_005002 [Penicillium rubens]KAJ5867807.1 hypothetical protein N7534_002360 [Penicillium rubens]